MTESAHPTSQPSLPPLSGPEVAPASGGAAKQLVVFLHGVGADGEDLIGMSEYIAQILPDAAFVSPNAPFGFDMAPNGYQWFSLQERTPQSMLDGVTRAAPALNAFLDAQLAKHGLTDADLALIGFSQGTMMALHVALRRAQPCAGIVGFSGMLIAPDVLVEEITARPPVRLIHGEDDEVLSAQLLDLAGAALTTMNVPVQGFLRPGLGHGIDSDGLLLCLQFLKDRFLSESAA